jgi:hypothetical protein
MGVFTRDHSPYWWLYLESTHQKLSTKIRIGTTAEQRKDGTGAVAA